MGVGTLEARSRRGQRHLLVDASLGASATEVFDLHLHGRRLISVSQTQLH
jgi:hypothetical protein